MNAQRPMNPTKKRDRTARLTPAVAPVLESLEARTLMAVTAPTGLTVATVSASQLNVAWVDRATNETSYVLDRALGSGNFKPIASLPADANSYGDAGLTPGTKYRYPRSRRHGHRPVHGHHRRRYDGQLGRADLGAVEPGGPELDGLLD